MATLIYLSQHYSYYIRGDIRGDKDDTRVVFTVYALSCGHDFIGNRHVLAQRCDNVDCNRNKDGSRSLKEGGFDDSLGDHPPTL